MKRLIINADDLGWTEGVNRGIVEAHRNGIVTSTTLLANGIAFDSAVRLARQENHLGVGVHLNLSDGAPILPRWEVPSLVGADGQFRGGPGRLAAKIFARAEKHGRPDRECLSRNRRLSGGWGQCRAAF